MKNDGLTHFDLDSQSQCHSSPQRDTATQRTQSVTAHTFRINAFSWCWGFICAFQSLKLRHILRPLHPEAPLWDSNRKITCYLFYSTLSDARIVTFKEKRTGLLISDMFLLQRLLRSSRLLNDPRVNDSPELLVAAPLRIHLKLLCWEQQLIRSNHLEIGYPT